MFEEDLNMAHFVISKTLKNIDYTVTISHQSMPSRESLCTFITDFSGEKQKSLTEHEMKLHKIMHTSASKLYNAHVKMSDEALLKKIRNDASLYDSVLHKPTINLCKIRKDLGIDDARRRVYNSFLLSYIFEYPDPNNTRIENGSVSFPKIHKHLMLKKIQEETKINVGNMIFDREWIQSKWSSSLIFIPFSDSTITNSKEDFTMTQERKEHLNTILTSFDDAVKNKHVQKEDSNTSFWNYYQKCCRDDHLLFHMKDKFFNRQPLYIEPVDKMTSFNIYYQNKQITL